MLHQGQHVFFGCAVGQAARIPFWLEHAAATRTPRVTRRHAAHATPTPRCGQSPMSPRPRRGPARVARSALSLPVLAVLTTVKQAAPVKTERSARRGNLHVPHGSATLRSLYKHEKRPMTGASLVRATVKVPSKKATKIPWRIKALVASWDGGVGLHMAGGPEGRRLRQANPRFHTKEFWIQRAERCWAQPLREVASAVESSRSWWAGPLQGATRAGLPGDLGLRESRSSGPRLQPRQGAQGACKKSTLPRVLAAQHSTTVPSLGQVSRGH